MPSFELRGVTKRFGAVEALRSLDLRIEAGRTAVLIGPSGCGKSTILRLMTGLIRPDSGSVLFHGAELDPSRILEFRREMGYVIQEGGLFPTLPSRTT